MNVCLLAWSFVYWYEVESSENKDGLQGPSVLVSLNRFVNGTACDRIGCSSEDLTRNTQLMDPLLAIPLPMLSRCHLYRGVRTHGSGLQTANLTNRSSSRSIRIIEHGTDCCIHPSTEVDLMNGCHCNTGTYAGHCCSRPRT